jgi:hypothetical protein
MKEYPILFSWFFHGNPHAKILAPRVSRTGCRHDTKIGLRWPNAPRHEKAMMNPMKFLCICLFLLNGCSSIPRSEIDNSPPFTSHKNIIERSSAQTGYVLGCVVGIPVSIIALPATRRIASQSTDAQGGLLVFSPMFGLGYGVGTIVGTALWPLCGWYELGVVEDEKSNQKSAGWDGR